MRRRRKPNLNTALDFKVGPNDTTLDFLESQYQKDPYRLLWCAVLERAIIDYKHYTKVLESPSYGKSHHQGQQGGYIDGRFIQGANVQQRAQILRKALIGWFNDEYSEYTGSFSWICDTLDIKCKEKIRALLK